MNIFSFRKVGDNIVATFIPYSKEVLKSKAFGRFRDSDRSAMYINLTDPEILKLAFSTTYSSR